MGDFLNFILTIFGWIIEGIRHVLIFIENIPYYLTQFVNLNNYYVPAFLLPFVILGITVTVIIHIKRLVF